jgi:hypothetical protein
MMSTAAFMDDALSMQFALYCEGQLLQYNFP